MIIHVIAYNIGADMKNSEENWLEFLTFQKESELQVSIEWIKN